MLALALSCASHPGAAAPRSASTGAPLQFSFASPTGARVSSETTRGRATAILFITTYDLPSQVVAQRLAAAVRNTRPRSNAAAVVLEAPSYAELVSAYAKEMDLPYPVAIADFATYRGQGPFGSITSVPTVVLLDRQGREVARHTGDATEAQLRQWLQQASGAAEAGGPEPDANVAPLGEGAGGSQVGTRLRRENERRPGHALAIAPRAVLAQRR